MELVGMYKKKRRWTLEKGRNFRTVAFNYPGVKDHGVFTTYSGAVPVFEAEFELMTGYRRCGNSFILSTDEYSLYLRPEDIHKLMEEAVRQRNHEKLHLFIAPIKTSASYLQWRLPTTPRKWQMVPHDDRLVEYFGRVR